MATPLPAPLGAARPRHAGVEAPFAFVAPWHHAECRHAGRALLDAQLWCLGQDILCAGGNLLSRYGAERDRTGLLPRQPTCYRVVTDDGARLTLWGYGLWLADPATGLGCFVRRKGFAPLLTAADWPAASAFANDDRPARRPRSGAEGAALVALTGRLVAWCADYERWIARVTPAAWRPCCEGRRPRHVRRASHAARADALVAGWVAMAERLAGQEAGRGAQVAAA